MTQEDKQLLLKDLCARLPYGVKLDFYSNATKQHYISTLIGIEPDGERPIIAKVENGAYTLGQDHIKPYLRPMSSMTEEERSELSREVEKSELGISDEIKNGFITDIAMSSWVVVSYCLKKHLDINCLIEKGLALEATEGMYN